MKNIKSLFFVVTVICALSIATIASSLTLDCVLTDLDDSLGPGGDLWQATYPSYYPIDNSTLNGYYWFENYYNFAIVFYGDLYQSVEWVDTPWNSGMVDYSIELSPWHDSYILFSFVGHVGNTGSFFVFPFTIQFIWLGDGDPGRQPWTIYSDVFDSPFFADPLYFGYVNITDINRLPEPEPTPLPAALPAILMLLLE